MMSFWYVDYTSFWYHVCIKFQVNPQCRNHRVAGLGKCHGAPIQQGSGPTGLRPIRAPAQEATSSETFLTLYLIEKKTY